MRAPSVLISPWRAKLSRTTRSKSGLRGSNRSIMAGALSRAAAPEIQHALLVTSGAQPREGDRAPHVGSHRLARRADTGGQRLAVAAGAIGEDPEGARVGVRDV